MNDDVKDKPRQPIVVFKSTMRDLIERKEFALPSSVSPEAFMNAAIVAFQDNPMIQTCDQASVFKALRKLAAAGLVPDGREAALVPFKTKVDGNYVSVCQAMPMVFGLIKTARNSGEIADIRAHIVYQREIDEARFTYVVGDQERLEHQPILFGDKGEPVAAYAIANCKDGSIIREFMGADEIDKVRRSGASQLNFEKGQRPTVSEQPKGIWGEWTGEMWKKTVIRRMCKRLPISAEDQRRIMADEDPLPPIRDVTPQPTRLEQKIAAARAERAPQPAQEAHDVVTGEVMDAEPAAHWTASVDLSNAFPGSKAFTEGADAFKLGQVMTDCPYDGDEQAAADWLGGFDGARRAGE